MESEEPQQFGVIPAQAGIQRLYPRKTLGPRLRGDDNRVADSLLSRC
jgi:hypothetical protein